MAVLLRDVPSFLATVHQLEASGDPVANQPEIREWWTATQTTRNNLRYWLGVYSSSHERRELAQAQAELTKIGEAFHAE